ncbi:MAG: DUF3050 domain-containing protein [Polyangiaceae bacterium]
MHVEHDPYRALLQAVAPERERLLAHSLYGTVTDPRALRTFMEAHVFAVWDFMSLLKALQQKLTCVAVPWTPPPSRAAARLINEIVLGEESDEVAPGLTMSHFELYVEAMTEVGADTGQITRFIAELGRGARVDVAIGALALAPHVGGFVRDTLATAMSSRVESIAASFLVGREDLVPAMFRRLLPSIERNRAANSLRRYLARHIEVDDGEHGPLARRLLGELCGSDLSRWHTATVAARTALRARIRLWDGVIALIPPVRAAAPLTP